MLVFTRVYPSNLVYYEICLRANMYHYLIILLFIVYRLKCGRFWKPFIIRYWQQDDHFSHFVIHC
jgi:hypothetical protein